MFLDAHLHLQDVAANARELILQKPDTVFFCNGIQPTDWTSVAQFAKDHANVRAFFGVHPWFAEKTETGWESVLESFLKNNPHAAIGEIGLDRAKKDVDFETQKKVFIRQLEIAESLQRPVAIHAVRAWGELLGTLRKGPKPRRFMLHSYHGPLGVLSELLALGAFISFSWKWLRKETDDLIDCVRCVPKDRLLLETDFPYTEPGAVGEDPSAEKYSSCLEETYQLAAAMRGVDVSMLQKMVGDNGTLFLH